MRYRFTSLLITAGAATLLAGCEHFQTSTHLSSPSSKAEATTVADSSSANQTIMNGQSTTTAVPLATLSTAQALQSLIQQQQVSELRTAYNGSYGASLLFHADQLKYYVAMFQRNDFWRVVETTDYRKAEQTFSVFVDNTKDLAATDIERIRLQAEHRFMEKQIALRSTELDALQSDLAIQRQHERAIAAYQQRTRQEAERLSEQQQSVQAQLRALQRQIDALELQKNQINDAIDLHLD